MEKGKQPDKEELNKDHEEEEGGLDWLLETKSSELLPMDSNVLSRQQTTSVDSCSTTFTRDKIFKAASQGDTAQLNDLLEYLQFSNKQLTSPDFIDETNGKTALLKALLNLKNGKNDTIKVLLDIAEKTGDLEKLINASYRDPYYKGELPLSLAASTNQPEIVSFLMDNPYKRADLTDRDSQGNTVLHTLIVIADNTKENTEMISRMYDEILIRHSKLETEKHVLLELIENNQGLTPLKLAAKLGKIGMFKHMLHREFKDEETIQLSRKFTEWVYGPVHSSLHDMSSIDTNENNSVLEIIINGSEIPNRPKMLQIEPLHSILQDKWERFASKIFLMNFLVYLLYLSIFTTVAFYRKGGQPPFPIENVPADYFRCVGELISVLGAARFLYKTITIFQKNPAKLKALFTDGFSEILFFLQAVLLLISAALYCSGRREYVGLLVLSLALAWMNVLYYTRGSKQLGIYNVMMQRMILGDLLHFLCVYSVLLFGFSAAIVTLIDASPAMANSTLPQRSLDDDDVQTFKCQSPSYNDVRFTILELFKFTIGMGNLEFTDHVQYKEVFYILLISYIVLTYILMLNMLIALMGNTVEKTSEQSEAIWNLQRAFTILDMESSVPTWLKNKVHSRVSETVCFRNEDKSRRFVRVTEMDWKKWRSDLGVKLEEPVNEMKPEVHTAAPATTWSLNGLLGRIRANRRQQQSSNII
ncbi:transient receptor potential cation channel subfamily V member 1-like isoform X2 [Melanotaenia boesemani]|uniref:transient receptor potential cation channel subfamily V member 1-like isoform X2 n=1 Tax=Melanotaenia boesemani TaxID=1250792 RepID=UPI001C04F19E|nr:transient receptor potential cation channel subfamily V member 1-like isoform X2 [Melanotaenia boesemani]